MKKLTAIAAAVAMLGGPALALGGVVIEEQQVVDQPNGGKVTLARIVMIEGDRQKFIIGNGGRTAITDLGNGTMTMVDSTHKAYAEIPFPPKSRPGAAITLKKTGAHDRLIGYACDVYSGSGTVGGNAVSMTGCFSRSAPGASDYSAFQRKLADEVKAATSSNPIELPEGVPLTLAVITTKGGTPAAPGQTAKTNQMTHRQFTTRTTVTRITSRTLTPDSFEVPAGYRKQ
jgi:hypothetical protein